MAFNFDFPLRCLSKGSWQYLIRLTGGTVGPENGRYGGISNKRGYNAVESTVGGVNPQAAKLGKTFDTVTKQVMATVDALVGFITTLTQAKTAVTGAVGGGLAGAGLGQTLAPMLTQLMGPLAGALAPVIGGAIGAIMGGILGAKNAQVKANIDQMNTTFKAVMLDFSQNTNNLQATITQLYGLLQEAQQMQANSKKELRISKSH